MKVKTEDTAKKHDKETKERLKAEKKRLREERRRERAEERRRKKEIIYIDDNHTVSNMNVEGMPWYVKGGYDRKKAPDKMSFKEKFALVMGAYRAYLPIILGIGLGFLFVFLLLKLIWS